MEDSILKLLRQSDEPERPDLRPWPYSVGTRGVNRVRVYDRADSGCIQVEFFDDIDRHQMSLRTVLGEPVTDRTLARDIADRMSAAQARKRNALARELVFGTTMTLGVLLDKLHASAKAKKWSETHRKGQDRFRAFWLDKLGKDTPLTRIGSDDTLVEGVIEAAATERGWEEQTRARYLTYIVGAFNFAARKLKALDQRHTLSDVDIPTGEGRRRDLAFSREESDRILPELRKADPRAYVVGEAYYQAGRRLNATRLLRAADVQFQAVTVKRKKVEVAVVTYQKEHDKRHRTSEAVFVGDVVGVLRELLATPAVLASGLLMPAGDLQVARPGAGPIRKETLNEMFKAAEKAAGIAHVKGRSFHGEKRRYAGDTRDTPELASLQAATSKGMLFGTYNPDDDLEGKAALADSQDRRRRGR